MKVSEAVVERRSIRQFLDKPVPEDVLNSLLEKASRSPSGGNLQPWYIHAVTGDSLTRLKDVMDKAIEANPNGEGGEYDFYPNPMPEKYQARNFKSAGDMYDLLGISRDEELMRAAVKARNWEFFGAPVGLFFSLDNIMASNQWAHIGMYMQTLALLAVEHGLGTCMQEAWAIYTPTIRSFLDLPDDRLFYCGMALGYVDPDAPVNTLITEREPLENFVTFMK